MSENEQGRTAIAERIMGWHLRADGKWLIEWVDEQNIAQCETIDWHPDTDITQAMSVAKRLRDLGFLGDLQLNPAVCGGLAEFTLVVLSDPDDPGWYARRDTLEEAIYDVAVMVAKRMEKEAEQE